MNKEKESLVKELKIQIIEDFAEFGQGNSILTVENMADVCKVVETLGVNF